MSYSERQRRLLGAMGIRLWQQPAHRVLRSPAAPADAVDAAEADAPQPAPLVDAAAPSTGSTGGTAWAALREAIAGCRACELHQTRQRPVIGAAALPAHWMIVGDAPGELEDQAGEPFIGAPGQLLDCMLAALRLRRADDKPGEPAQLAYVTSPLKCSLPRSRSAGAEALARCAPFLQQQMALVQPRVLLAMGPFAVKALLQSDQPVGRLRGQVHRCNGVPLVVTYHPGYLLRNPHDKARAWEDLCLASQAAEAGG